MSTDLYLDSLKPQIPYCNACVHHAVLGICHSSGNKVDLTYTSNVKIVNNLFMDCVRQ